MLEPENQTDLLIIGAGPAGLHAACVAQDLGLSHRVIDRRGLAHSFVEYPQTLRFFSPPDEMEVGGVPLPMRGGEKPSREDILPYFRAVAAYRQLNLSLWEEITDLRREGGHYVVQTVPAPCGGEPRLYRGRHVLLAAGVWDAPNRLDCPGEELPHVFSRFEEPTEFFGMEVLVVGGGNSAAGAAMILAEAKAKVTLAMRRNPADFQNRLRPFVLRDLQFHVEEGKLDLRTGVRVARIEPYQTWLEPMTYNAAHPRYGEPSGEPYPVPARFVFSLIGQRADPAFLERIGLCLRSDGRPVHDPETFETNLPNFYIAGSLADKKIDIIIAIREQVAGIVHRIKENAPSR